MRTSRKNQNEKFDIFLRSQTFPDTVLVTFGKMEEYGSRILNKREL